MLLSIITLNYKKSNLTVKCINSLFDQLGEEIAQDLIEIIVVDNASDDGSVAEIEDTIKKYKSKNAKLIKNNENFGFSKGCNIGAREAYGKYLLFLNNDTEIEDKGIVKMTEYMEENREAAILGGLLKNSNGEEQSSTGKFYNLYNTFLLLISMQRFGVIDRNPIKITEVDWVKGALLMIRKEVFDALSGFDEQIFMYTEDMELCFRAKKSGYKTFFYPDIDVIHHDQGSSSRSFAVIQIYKGLLYFYKKHRSTLEYKLIKLMLYVKAVIAITIGTLTGNKYLTTTFKKAIQF